MNIQDATGEVINVEKQRLVEGKMAELLRKEELMWKQRSRVAWLSEGDKNTSFFHRMASGRQKRNCISQIRNSDGVLIQDINEVENVFRLYFVDLFTHREDIDTEETLAAVNPIVTGEMNSKLNAPFTKEEIIVALSQMHSLKAPGPDGERQPNMTVAELLTDDGLEWDEEKIQQLVPPSVAQKICTIPLPLYRGTDQIMWRHTKNGIYSVRSGYFIACQMRDDQLNISVTSADSSSVWKWIHGLKVLPKIQHFLWASARGRLPVATELRRRQVQCDILCQRCGVMGKMVEHALRDCEWMRFYWQVSPLRLNWNEGTSALTMKDWFKLIAKESEPRFQTLFGVLLWMGWKQRNQLIFQQTTIPTQTCIERAMKLHEEYWNLTQTCSRTHQGRDKEKWQPPEEGVWKVNVDATTQPGVGVGIGIVIRTGHGKIVVTRCKRLKSLCSAEMAEGLACQEGLVLAREFGGRRLILETDCQLIHRLLQKTDDDLSYVGEICQSIRIETT
ncbi:hypothetical protein C2S52_012871 [Perilla frutescens var. hirtella]|nr:hypothetical protein C2S52_012871 [Perilla frutescens var. hirtella]